MRGVFRCIVLLLSCTSWCFSAPRHPRVAEVLLKHSALVCDSVNSVRERDVYGLLDVFLPPCPPKAAYVPSKARENTIVDASLSTAPGARDAQVVPELCELAPTSSVSL